MKWFTMIVVSALFTVLFLSCEGTKTTTKDTDTLLGDTDTLLGDEDEITPTDEEEPEGEETVKDDGPVAKDDGPVAKDDGPVVTDDTPVVTDDGEVEPDEDVVVTDDIVTDEVVTDEVVTDEVVTDEIQPDDDQIETFTIGWCNLQYPADATVTEGGNITYYGRVYIADLTDLTVEVDTHPQVIGQLSGNPSFELGVDASTWATDGWLDLLPNPDNENSPEIGNNDEYLLEVPLMLGPGTMDIAIRFSGDGGATWTYCNANREPSYNGTDAENPYDPAKHGRLTIEAAYDDPCEPGDNACQEPNRSVCTDANMDGVAECGCDENYTLDGGDTCINEKFVDCAANPTKPLNSHDIITQVKVNYTDLNGWGDPELCTDWDCNATHHWNEDEEACLETLDIGWCNLQWPTDASFYRGEVVSVYGRLYIAGLTDLSLDVDPAPQVIVQAGSGTVGTNAAEWPYWGDMEPNPDSSVAPGIGEDDDEYQYIGPVTETLGDWDMSVRVSGDSGATWTYCNANRPGDGYNGTDSDNPYDLTKNGHFTVITPCDEGFCNESHKTVCDDSDEDPFYVCSCDENYNDDDNDGDCDPDTRTEPCVTVLPPNAYWGVDEEHDGEGNVIQTWNGEAWLPSAGFCPYECYGGYHKEDGSCVPDVRTVNCTDNKPENSHWVADGDYNGDGTVDQTWIGTEWQPPADECPWACDVDHHVRYDPFGGFFCDPDTRLVACTNELPLSAVWTAVAPYDGTGNLTQTWNGGSYEPATDTCPSECPSDHHWNGSACEPNVRLVGCGFELPVGAVWVASLPTYDGIGNLTQTWNPGTDEYEPDDTTCPFDCTLPNFHPNYEVHECLLTYAIGWCNLQSPNFHNGLFDTWLDVYGRLWIDGVTNVSDINNTDHTISPYLPQIKAQLGAGLRDTMPDDENWNWLAAIPNEDYGNDDEYMLHVQLNLPPGLYDYAYRFSGDSGTTWTYCDLNGSADGYTTDQAGKLTVMCDQNADCNENPAGPICAPWSMCVECMDGGDCEDWEDCNANVCELQTGKCSDNGDCEEWEQCNESHECELAPGRCTVDDDCTADGKVCDEPVYTCKLPGKLVINEVDYDQYSTDTTEYVEIFNSGEMPYDMTGVVIEFWNGSNNSLYATHDLAANDQSATQVLPGQYYVVSYASVTDQVKIDHPSCITKTVISGFLIQNGDPDGMVIMDDGVALDGLHYVDPANFMIVGEGSTAPDDNASTTDILSIGRCPNGADTDDNGADFVVMTSTPGAANTCL